MKPSSQAWKRIAGQALVPLVVFLFFARGFCTVLIEALVPKLKSAFELSYTEVMLTQLCFFLGYFFFSLPAAAILARLGYIRTIWAGLSIMIMGCLIFSPAALLKLYPGFLIALFVVAAGITILQVTTNPMISALGPSHSSHSRLTLAHAFNSLGTTIAPVVGAWLILSPKGTVYANQVENIGRVADPPTVQLPFLVVAAILASVGLLFWFFRNYPTPKTSGLEGNFASWLGLLKNPRFSLGTMSIFLYVGAEVSIGSILINYLMLDTVLGISGAAASELTSLYWGGAMCGRFIGAALLRIVAPNIALTCCALLATLLAAISAMTAGGIAAVAVIAIGLCNSIMFPTIFAMALEDLGDHRSQGSGILSTAIVGGAIVPIFTGIIADHYGLGSALLVPAGCYVLIASYAAYRGGPLRHAIEEL